MNLKENLSDVLGSIAVAQNAAGLKNAVTIVAVTKTHSPKTIEAVADVGLTDIGENRLQEAMKKFSLLSSEIKLRKRMIGHLQSNKVSKALKVFDSLDSVDSVKLAVKINRRALENNTVFPVLLEVNTSEEPQKNGFHPNQTEEMLSCIEMSNLQINGLMTVGPLTKSEARIRESFKCLRLLLERLNSERSKSIPPLKELSMGMSNDFTVAVEEGSTMVRLGTVLFGPRER
ncbi:MAG: YggS family pyridoxal phosphate-dependent enzyme [Fidelibacterota bacterium]